mmetsp:Transcript_53461/g.125733  ORF Transcript_53461/g.125733 Transcript_53461/m.125733 type:complete len:132 (-) Transcript_53461:11-406(-)
MASQGDSDDRGAFCTDDWESRQGHSPVQLSTWCGSAGGRQPLNLVVCDSHNHRLQIVTTEGRFVRTIGSRGRGNLQFTYPSGVAVLEDGNLVVCDGILYGRLIAGSPFLTVWRCWRTAVSSFAILRTTGCR